MNVCVAPAHSWDDAVSVRRRGVMSIRRACDGSDFVTGCTASRTSSLQDLTLCYRDSPTVH